MDNSPGRLVWNHSTHVPGLISILERLTHYPGIRTITPGALSSARSRSQKIRLKISVPIRGGFKLIARKGKTAQEVFILTTLERGALEEAVASAIASSR